MKKHKALPAPIDKVKKRRGGKRFRKFKEQFEVTELARQANRMEFNVAQVCVGQRWGRSTLHLHSPMHRSQSLVVAQNTKSGRVSATCDTLLLFLRESCGENSINFARSSS
jgi:hypothetical protein